MVKGSRRFLYRVAFTWHLGSVDKMTNGWTDLKEAESLLKVYHYTQVWEVLMKLFWYTMQNCMEYVNGSTSGFCVKRFEKLQTECFSPLLALKI